MNTARSARIAVRIAAVAALGGGGVLALGGSAGAVTPARTAWWNEAPLGVVPLPTQAGADQLVIGQGAGGPSAVAAVLYTLTSTDSADPGSAGATLELRVNSGSSVGSPAVVACPVSSGSQDWKSGGNQPGGDAPKYDCSPGTEVKGVSPDGTNLVFGLTPSQQVPGSPGTFNLAIVPDPASSQPFQVVANAPSGNDFVVSNPPQAAQAPEPPPVPAGDQSGVTDTLPPAESAPPVDTPFASGPVPAAPAPVAPAPSGTTAAPAPRPSAGVVAATGAPAAASGGLFGGRRQQLLGVWLMIDAGLALAFFGGRTDRMPRLLGSLAARRGDATTMPPGVEMGGIGRFARPRSGPPRRI